jgi:hypothetical protein
MRAPQVGTWGMQALRSSVENTAVSSGARHPRTSPGCVNTWAGLLTRSKSEHPIATYTELFSPVTGMNCLTQEERWRLQVRAVLVQRPRRPVRGAQGEAARTRDARGEKEDSYSSIPPRSASSCWRRARRTPPRSGSSRGSSCGDSAHAPGVRRNASMVMSSDCSAPSAKRRRLSRRRLIRPAHPSSRNAIACSRARASP